MDVALLYRRSSILDEVLGSWPRSGGAGNSVLLRDVVGSAVVHRRVLGETCTVRCDSRRRYEPRSGPGVPRSVREATSALTTRSSKFCAISTCRSHRLRRERQLPFGFARLRRRRAQRRRRIETSLSSTLMGAWWMRHCQRSWTHPDAQPVIHTARTPARSRRFIRLAQSYVHLLEEPGVWQAGVGRAHPWLGDHPHNVAAFSRCGLL